jgi:hypothetical protein
MGVTWIVYHVYSELRILILQCTYCISVDHFTYEKHNGHFVAVSIFSVLCWHVRDKLVCMHCNCVLCLQWIEFVSIRTAFIVFLSNVTFMKNTMLPALQWESSMHFADTTETNWSLCTAIILKCNRRRSFSEGTWCMTNHMLYECSPT